MKNFSSISNINQTEKDHLITEMIQISGLEKPIVNKLYDQFLFEGDGSLAGVAAKFKDFSAVAGDGLEDIIDKISQLLKDLNVNRNEVILNLLLGRASNPIALVKIIVFILLSKNKANFLDIAKNIKLDFKLGNLMESVEIINNNDDGSSETPAEKAKFYGDLRTILAKNNGRFGNAYHLDNVHNTIIEYLDREIEEIINRDNVNTVTDTFHTDFINQILENKMNPMYANINTLRTMIPDIQTLVFDMMCLVTTFVRNNEDAMQYISRDTYNQYFEATRNLYGGISSSRKASKVCSPFVEPNTDASSKEAKDEIPGFRSTNVLSNKILDNIQIDYNKFEIYNIQPVNVIDMVNIMKSCGSEFNLKTRSLLRNYVTKALEILSKSHKVISQRKQINKYKNGY